MKIIIPNESNAHGWIVKASYDKSLSHKLIQRPIYNEQLINTKKHFLMIRI